jgi:hypothetical protein
MHGQHNQRSFEAPGAAIFKESDDTVCLGGMAEQWSRYSEQFNSGHVFADNGG